MAYLDSNEDEPAPADRSAEQARFALESWVHQQTPTKTLSQDQVEALTRLVDNLAAALSVGGPEDD